MVLFNKFIIEVCLCTLVKFWNSQRIFKSEVTLIKLKVVLTYRYLRAWYRQYFLKIFMGKEKVICTFPSFCVKLCVFN